MKALLKTLAHGFVSGVAVGFAAAVGNGGAITTGHVIFPALTAGVFGAVHAIMPSTVGGN